MAADTQDQHLDLLRQVVQLCQIDVLDSASEADADGVAAEEQNALVCAVRHVLRRLEKRELVVARLRGVGAEVRAVAALVAHLIDVDDLRPAVGQHDRDIGAVRAGIDAVLADGIAAQAARTLAAGVLRHFQNALLRDGLRLRRIGRRRDLVGMRLADNGFRERGGIGNALNDGRGAAMRVARAPDVFDVGLEGGAFALHFNAVCGHELCIDLFTDGREHQIARDLKEFAGPDRCAASGSVRLAELHLLKTQLAVLLLDGDCQLDHLNAFVDGEFQLVLVGGHFLFGAAVDDG